MVKKEEKLKKICTTTYRQICWGVGLNVMFSWGIDKKYYGIYNDMPTLMLQVNGLLHKGWVYISLDEGQDLYVVYLLDNNKNIVKTIDSVYCDTLGTIIDSNVERKAEWSDKKYEEEYMQEYNKIAL